MGENEEKKDDAALGGAMDPVESGRRTAPDRRERQAATLRANLKRRKEQQRGRQGAKDGSQNS